MVIFIELVQYAKNLGGKSRENLVEDQIIKIIRKLNSIICRFFAPHSQDNAFSLLHVWGAKTKHINHKPTTPKCFLKNVVMPFQ